MQQLQPNEGKACVAVIDGVSYQRLPIKTHLITKNDDIVDVAVRYAAGVLSGPDDVLFISGKCVSCSQDRAIPLRDIHPGKLAIWLSDHVTRTPYGIGLGMPETMEMAMQEVGTPRLLFAAAASVIGKKIFKKKGWFYSVAGYKARAIAGPCHNTIPPYNHYVILGPENPDQVARDCAEKLGCRVIIVDIGDLGGRILGASDPRMDRDLYVRILKDNPLGQDDQQTPMGIIRAVK